MVIKQQPIPKLVGISPTTDQKFTNNSANSFQSWEFSSSEKGSDFGYFLRYFRWCY